MSTSLVRVPPEQWPALAELIRNCNRRPDGGVHCLHAACGADIASHAAELAALLPGGAAFWAVTERGERVGVVGCTLDPAWQRAWVRGPLAIHPRQLEDLLPIVGPTLESALPDIKQFNAFPAAAGALLNDWYAAAGYEPLELHRVLRAAIGEVPDEPRRVRPATTPDLPAVLDLHQELFPSAYIGAADFQRATEDGDCVLFVAGGDDGAPIGYLYAQDSASEQEAYVDYLGVSPSHRGKGLGRALLDGAARWGARHGRGHLALTVREDRLTALNLYRQAGFAEVSAGRHWQKLASHAA